MNYAGWMRSKAQHNREVKAERLRRSDPLHQGGRIQTAYGIALDAARMAMLPGRRISASGHRYYERRVNRSDRSRNKKL